MENSSSQIHKTENWILRFHRCLNKTKSPLVRNKLTTEPIQLLFCFLWEKILQKRTYPDSSASKANACSSSTKVSICVCKISCCINFNYQEKKLINHAKGKNCLVFRLLFW